MIHAIAVDDDLELCCRGDYILQVGKRRFAKVVYT